MQLIDAKLNCLSYADDLLLLSESKEGLQSFSDSVKAYCERWKLKVNLNKTKIMIHFFYDNLEIEIVERYKYLGIIIYFNGNFKHAAEHLYNQSLKALFSLHSKIFGFNNIDHRLKLKLFNMLIKPIRTYGSEIWINDFTLKDFCIDELPFEKIHNKFCKNILGVHKKANILQLNVN